ncbi:MAG: gamma-glutamyltransferase [bacterium]|nr:gamma-glutamyltransferase [bacterium]
MTEKQQLPSAGVRYASNGMVASASARAAAAGVHVLKQGGNAFDAAIAVAGVEWLTMPASCGLGGDMFAVLYEARNDRIAAINGSGVAALQASRDYFVNQGLDKMPLDGWHAAAVPGAPHAYATLNAQFGTMPLGELLSPVMTYAEEGIVASNRMSGAISGASKKLGKFPDSVAAYLPNGCAPRPGDRWAMPDLAQTIRAFAEGGSDVFYGDIADEIVRASQEGGGLFGKEEFVQHRTDVYEPLHTCYRGVDVYETAPPSQGLMVLEWLNLLEGYDLQSEGFGSVEAMHLMVEAKKLAFADRLRYCGDPRFIENPLAELLSSEYAEMRRKAIDLGRANNEPLAGDLPEKGGDTSYFAVADGEGNAISLIHSLSAGFGSGVVAGKTGVVLNNRAGRGFTLEEGHPNVIAGGKKTMHTLNCYLLCKEGRFWGVGGTPGGDRQVQWNVQTISNLLDFGMDVQEAVEAPRWVSWPGTDPAAIETPLELRVERRFEQEVIAELEERGHRVSWMEDWGAGGAVQLILRDEHGTLCGGSDPRAGGVALGC